MDIVEELMKKDRERLLAIDEQSRTRDWAEDYVTGFRTTIVRHLICTLLFGINCSSLPHWCSELHNWLYEFSTITLKPHNKRIKEKDLQKWLCDEFLTKNSFHNAITQCKNKEQQFKPIYEQVLEDNYIDFVLWYKNLISFCSSEEYSEEVLVNAIYDWYETH